MYVHVYDYEPHHEKNSILHIHENKGADQPHSNCEADQRLCFHYIGSTIPLLSKSKISRLAIYCSCTAQFVSALVGNHFVGFLMKQQIYVHVWSTGSTALAIYVQKWKPIIMPLLFHKKLI